MDKKSMKQHMMELFSDVTLSMQMTNGASLKKALKKIFKLP